MAGGIERETMLDGQLEWYDNLVIAILLYAS